MDNRSTTGHCNLTYFYEKKVSKHIVIVPCNIDLFQNFVLFS